MLSKKKSSIELWLTCCYLMLFMLTACSTSTTAPFPSASKNSPSSDVPSLTVSPTRTPKLGAPGCKPPSPIDQSNLTFPEVQGTATGMEVWILLLGIPSAKQDAKIIWSITGDYHKPTLIALGPHGLRLAPLFGPEKHAGSDWSRPGDSWGSGFNFPIGGCWDLHVTRGTAVGDVWLIIS